jgi:hypothetical protein
VEERRPLRRQREDHHFGSLLMLARNGGRFPVDDLDCHKSAFCLPPRVSPPLKASWQKQVIASNGYRELGMFDYAAQALEEGPKVAKAKISAR